jgi:AsmA protein
MKKILKTLFYFILIVVVLVVVGGFFATRFINPNDYKDKITAIVHENTGRDLVVQGEIKLSFFPWIGVRVQDVQLSNAAGFTPANFASVGEADVRVKLMPLFSRQVEVGRITLKNLALNLAKNKQGVTNWDDLTAPPAAQKNGKKSSDNTDVAEKKPENTNPMLLSIAGVDIEKSSISWVDAQKNQTATFTNVEIKSDTPAMGRSFPFNVAFDVKSTEPDIAGHFIFNSDVVLDQNKEIYQLKNLRMEFSPLQKNAKAVSLKADRILADLKAQTLSLSKGVLSHADLNATVSLQAQKILDKPVFQGEFNAAPFNLKELLAVFGQSVATKDPSALEKVSLQTRFSGTDSSIKLDPFALQLDRSHMQGMLAVTDFASKALRFDLKVDEFNVDSYLPPESVPGTPNASPAGATVGAATAGSQAQPSAMRRLNLNGSLSVGKLVVAQTDINRLSVKMASQNGVLTFDPLNADIYKGTMRGKVAIDFRGAAPKYNIDETLSKIDMTQLVKSGRVVGQANVETHLTLQGQDKAQIMRSLNGNVRFNVQNGALLGKNIPYEVERAIALFKHQPAPPATAALDRTSFSALQGTGTFNGGVFNNNDLLMQSPQFKVMGSGTANLRDETLNYRLRFVGLETAVNAEGKSVEEERRTPISILVTGTFDKPIIAPDLQALIQGELGKKAVEKLQEKLGPDADRALGGFLKMLQK